MEKTRRAGRPRSEAAGSHATILDAVLALLQDTSVRDLTMEAVAKRAGVGKPTLYKWWPSKAALVFAMFHERLVQAPDVAGATSTEAIIRMKLRGLVRVFNGLFGKVMAELIAEGQSDPDVLRELYERHIAERRDAASADIERGKASGELRSDCNTEALVDALVAPIYYRLLLRLPMNETYVDTLIDQVLSGARQSVLLESPKKAN